MSAVPSFLAKLGAANAKGPAKDPAEESAEEPAEEPAKFTAAARLLPNVGGNAVAHLVCQEGQLYILRFIPTDAAAIVGRLPQTPGYGTELAWHTKFYAARSKAWIALAPVVKYTLLTSVTICTVGVVSEELTLLKDSVIEAGPLDKELLATLTEKALICCIVSNRRFLDKKKAELRDWLAARERAPSARVLRPRAPTTTGATKPSESTWLDIQGEAILEIHRTQMVHAGGVAAHVLAGGGGSTGVKGVAKSLAARQHPTGPLLGQDKQSRNATTPRADSSTVQTGNKAAGILAVDHSLVARNKRCLQPVGNQQLRAAGVARAIQSAGGTGQLGVVDNGPGTSKEAQSLAAMAAALLKSEQDKVTTVYGTLNDIEQYILNHVCTHSERLAATESLSNCQSDADVLVRALVQKALAVKATHTDGDNVNGVLEELAVLYKSHGYINGVKQVPSDITDITLLSLKDFSNGVVGQGKTVYVFYSPTNAHSPWNNSLVDDALSVIKGEELAPYDLNKGDDDQLFSCMVKEGKDLFAVLKIDEGDEHTITSHVKQYLTVWLHVERHDLALARADEDASAQRAALEQASAGSSDEQDGTDTSQSEDGSGGEDGGSVDEGVSEDGLALQGNDQPPWPLNVKPLVGLPTCLNEDGVYVPDKELMYQVLGVPLNTPFFRDPVTGGYFWEDDVAHGPDFPGDVELAFHEPCGGSYVWPELLNGHY